MRDDTKEDQWKYGAPTAKRTGEQDVSNEHIPRIWKRKLYH